MPVEDALAKQLNLEEGQGVVVADVAPDGPGKKAGVERYDILLAVGDAPLTDVGALSKRVDESDGKEFPLKLLRGGKELALKITPDKRPDHPYGLNEFRVRFAPNMLSTGERLNLTLGPGMFVLPFDRKKSEFPYDFEFTLTKEGNKPAQIEARQGDKSWKVSEDDLTALPENLRGALEGWLEGSPMLTPEQIRLQWIGLGAEPPPPPREPPPPPRSGDRRMPAAPRPPDDGQSPDAFDDGQPRPPDRRPNTFRAGPGPPNTFRAGPRPPGDRGPGPGGAGPGGGPPVDMRAIDEAVRRHVEHLEAQHQRQLELLHKQLDEISRQLRALHDDAAPDAEEGDE